ncbi:protein kinase domain-containing protein [Microbacterium arborescens]|uniref:protein kinase domain-containing protein n=1 Tax=Microbacterium arborescens TaxID=33883 RepID=UPI003C78EF7B
MAELRRRPRPEAHAPSEIAGRTVDRLLASGDRADVYLYRDAAGRDPVAVKILRDALADDEQAAFATAWPHLIDLSSHPSVASIHTAGTTEDGRMYLVMEYCSRADLAETTARRPASVPEALSLLVRLCGAVETAHLAGIAHGRLRIENVLMTDYGWPALIGFDSDALLRRGERTGSSSARAADVHGLAVAATELLTGRPIAEAGASRAGADSVPAALEALVIATLEATATGGGPSAAEFGRELQGVEADLHLPITHLDIRAADSGPHDTIDHTVLSTRRAAPDDHTVLASRRRTDPDHDVDPDDRTTISHRHTPGPDDRTTVVDRHVTADPDADHTVLASRRTTSDRDEDHTVLASRRTPADPDEDHTVLASRRATAEAAEAEPTALVRRSRRDEVVRGRVDTARLASEPDDGGERYRVRVSHEPAAVTRVRVDAPVRQPNPAGTTRRRRNGTVVAVIGAGVLVLGAAATALVMIIGGGA